MTRTSFILTQLKTEPSRLTATFCASHNNGTTTLKQDVIISIHLYEYCVILGSLDLSGSEDCIDRAGDWLPRIGEAIQNRDKSFDALLLSIYEKACR